MSTRPTMAALRGHERRVAAMLADPECVGELLLVGIAMARSVDLNDPPWPKKGEGGMDMRVIADAVYGHYRLTAGMLLPDRTARGDSNPRRRIRDVFWQDRRRYNPDLDPGAKAHWAVTCGRPMIRRAGLCGRSASDQRRVTDPTTGQRTWVGACSQQACKGWLTDLLGRNRAELQAHRPPVPPANSGGVLERHLPEIDWWAVWRHVDSRWSPPPEGRPFERPRLSLIVGADDPGPVAARPALVVHEGGWR